MEGGLENALPPLSLGRFELGLNVRNLAMSLDFYRKLGFVALSGDPEEGWMILRNGNCILALYQGHIEENLLNFRGTDVYALAEELKERGLVLEADAADEGDGSVGATLRDPDGNLIYLNTFPGESAEG